MTGRLSSADKKLTERALTDVVICSLTDSGRVKCEIELVLEFSDSEEAEKVLRSVSQDNEDWISAERDENRIICRARSKSIGGVLHTVEDFLSCVVLAEKVVRRKR